MKKLLFNPGPTNVSDKVRWAIKTDDICHREKEFTDVLLRVNKNILNIFNGEDAHSAVLFVSSGTGCNEAICSSIHGKVLVINNGKYSDRICEILEKYQIPISRIKMNPLEPISLDLIEKTLKYDEEVTHIYLVHHETTTGALAPLRKIGELAKKYNKLFCVDGVSSIGGHEFDLKEDNIAFCSVSANKCLESFPGVSFVIGRTEEIKKLEGKSRSFYFDIYAQWKKEQRGETPFTPAVQLIFALDSALQEYLKEGYQKRIKRYENLAEKMRRGLQNLGFELILFPKEMQSNILTTIKMQDGLNYWRIHDKLKDRGITIYSDENVINNGNFRVATLGSITESDVDWFLKNLEEVVQEEKSKVKAIILIAGRGSRLKPLTDSIPKCLTEVNGKTILENMLENLERAGVKESILVVGYMGDKIKEKIGGNFGRMNIKYVENKIYDETNSSYSLWLALKELDSEILILEGDVFFENELLARFLKSSSSNSTVVEKYRKELDGSFVEIKDGKVSDWIHKNRRPVDFILEDKFKTVNIHKFDADFVNNILKPFLEKHTKETNGTEPMEYIMQDIVKNNNGIAAFETGNLKWFEIDDINDLKIAEEIFKGNEKNLNNIAFKEENSLNKKIERLSIDKIRSFHGGYWRHNHIDFHYLFNHHFPTPEFYAEIAEKLKTIGNYYPSSQKVLAELLSKWKDEEYFIADNLIVANGSSELIRLFNDHVVTKATVPLPTFNEFIRLPDQKIHKYMLEEKEGFFLNPDKLIHEIKMSNSEFAVIINPNNPVGNLIPLEHIEKILKTGVNLMIDEAFMAFAGKEYSAEQLVPKYKNLIIIASCTKSIGIAGLRLGYLLSSNDEVKEKIRSHMPIWNINSMAEYVLEAFPKYKIEHAESIKKSVEDTTWFFEKLKEIPYLRPFPTYANAVFCKVDGSARKLAEILYDKYGLMVKEGLNQKDFNTDSYARLGVRNKDDNQKLIDALKEIKKEDIS